jgi:hypothetical protein
MRKTPLGHVCKDNGKWSRCAKIANELRGQRVVEFAAVGSVLPRSSRIFSPGADA